MADHRSVVDMVNNLGNKIFKKYISHNVTPAAVTESHSGLIQKLGLVWVQQYAPGFLINSRQVEILHEPQSFYKLLLEQIHKANKRIVLASLYLGTSSFEECIIQALKNRLDEKPELKVKILLDCTRGSRGEINSRKMMMPLLKDHSSSCQVRLYQTTSLRNPIVPFLPEKYKEILGLQHMKIYLIDDSFIITGANLNRDYFTNRQDRYMFISNTKDLSDFIEGLVDTVSEMSLSLDSEDRLSLPESWPHHPLKAEPNVFNFAASNRIRNYYEGYVSNSNTGEEDTVIFPLLEMGPFNIHVDSTVTTNLLKNCDSNSFVYLTTGYFNLTKSYINTIINESKAQYKILMAHPKANGFYMARGPAGGIPHAYTNIASVFLEMVKKAQESYRIKMFEYVRKDWTYHAKGLWLSPSEFEAPFLTLIGSPNFGERSEKRDLECQFLLATSDKTLQSELLKERKMLYESCLPFTEATVEDPERQTPLWVKVVVSLFKSYL